MNTVFLFNKRLFALFFFSLIFLMPFYKAYAGVFAHDGICVEGRPVMLTAETKGKFLRKGGERVSFHVNGKPYGKALSGGDAYAYYEFKPSSAGLYKITAVSSGEKDEALMLCLRKGSSVLFVDVSGGLLENPYTRKPLEGSRESLKKLSGAYSLVYLHTEMVGTALSKKWLKDNGFPAGPLLDWDGGGVFDKTASLGLKIKVVIGGPEVIASAKRFRPLTFSFSDTEDDSFVRDWKEIEKKLGVKNKK